MQVTVQSRPPGNIPPRPNPLTSTTPPPYPPNFPWVDTGVDIPNGYNLTITYVSGNWVANQGRPPYGPLGDTGLPAALPHYMLPGDEQGSLIEIIANNPTIFDVGNYKEIGNVQPGGRLYLACNDDIYQLYGNGYSDNVGEIVMDVEIFPPQGS